MTEERICYDIISHGRVVNMVRASNSEEALNIYDKQRFFVGYAKLNEGLWGYLMPGVGMCGTVARPSFSPS